MICPMFIPMIITSPIWYGNVDWIILCEWDKRNEKKLLKRFMIITCLDSNIKKLKNLQFILSQKQQYIRGGGILIAVFLVERILKSQFFMLFFSLSSWKKRHLLSIKSMLLLLKDTLIFLLYNLECDNKIINDGSLYIVIFVL